MTKTFSTKSTNSTFFNNNDILIFNMDSKSENKINFIPNNVKSNIDKTRASFESSMEELSNFFRRINAFIVYEFDIKALELFFQNILSLFTKIFSNDII
jgi:hypothetical protein